MTIIRVTHSSGRFDRSVKSVTNSSKVLRRTASLIAHTELSGIPLSALGDDPNWLSTRVAGRGKDECLVQWDKRVLRKTGEAFAHRLSLLTHRNANGKIRPFFHALVVPFEVIATGERFFAIVAHMPLDNTKLRARIWVSTGGGMVKLVKTNRVRDPFAKNVILADWNKNYRQENERAMIERHVARPAGLKQAWEGNVPRSGGTHGPRALIDGVLTDAGVVGSVLLTDDASSDHRPFLTTLTLGGKPIKPAPASPKPKLSPAQRKRLNRLERMVRNKRKLRPFQRRALRRLRAKAK